MESKFQLSFNSSGTNIQFRGRLAPSLFSLDVELHYLTHFDIYGSSTYCPEYYTSVRKEMFLSRFRSYPGYCQDVILLFYSHGHSLVTSTSYFSQRDFYILLLTLPIDVVCKTVPSKKMFIECFLMAYYALNLKYYNPEFDFDAFPF